MQGLLTYSIYNSECGAVNGDQESFYSDRTILSNNSLYFTKKQPYRRESASQQSRHLCRVKVHAGSHKARITPKQ